MFETWFTVPFGAGIVAVILIVDRLLLPKRSLMLHGVGDEIGHGLTAALWGILFAACGLPVAPLPLLIGGVAIDLDHVLMTLGWMQPQPGTSRPASHSLVAMLLVLAIAGLDRRRRVSWASAALGVGAHFFRDIGTGAVALWWPLPLPPVSMSYGLYATASCGIVIATALLLGGSGKRVGRRTTAEQGSRSSHAASTGARTAPCAESDPPDLWLPPSPPAVPVSTGAERAQRRLGANIAAQRSGEARVSSESGARLAAHFRRDAFRAEDR